MTREETKITIRHLELAQQALDPEVEMARRGIDALKPHRDLMEFYLEAPQPFEGALRQQLAELAAAGEAKLQEILKQVLPLLRQQAQQRRKAPNPGEGAGSFSEAAEKLIQSKVKPSPQEAEPSPLASGEKADPSPPMIQEKAAKSPTKEERPENTTHPSVIRLNDMQMTEEKLKKLLQEAKQNRHLTMEDRQVLRDVKRDLEAKGQNALKPRPPLPERLIKGYELMGNLAEAALEAARVKADRQAEREREAQEQAEAEGGRGARKTASVQISKISKGDVFEISAFTEEILRKHPEAEQREIMEAIAESLKNQEITYIGRNSYQKIT